VEASDRGLLQARNRHEDARALRRARIQAKERDELDAALQRLLLAQAPDGRGVSKTVKELHRLALEDPAEFSVQVGEQLPGLRHLADNVAREEFAAAVADRLGCEPGSYPRTNERLLWDLWEAIKPA
jgi:hypothetical protein